MNKYDIFISYRRVGGALYAQTLQEILEKKGYRVFLDYDGLQFGDSSQQTDDAIKDAPIFIIVLSEGSMEKIANENDWMRKELETAINENKHIIAVNPDNTFDGLPDSITPQIKEVIENAPHSVIDFDRSLYASVDHLIRKHIRPIAFSMSQGVGSAPIDRSSKDHAPSHCPPMDSAIEEKFSDSAITNSVDKHEDSHRNSDSYRAVSSKPSLLKRIFGKKSKGVQVDASAYAPAAIRPGKDFLVRIFINRPEDTDKINALVKEIDKDSIKKANKPLSVDVKDGDNITVMLSMTDGVSIDAPMQPFTWLGRHIECDFICTLQRNGLENISGKAIIAVNNIPKGDLKFTIDVVHNVENTCYSKVDCRKYSKIFISYSHADYPQVRGIAEGCKITGTDYFFDRHTLGPGDIFKDKIIEYIDNADLFVLCWSKNAAVSEWVQIEREHALKLISEDQHQLALYPLSLRPEAPLPLDMRDKYNFATLE